MVWYGMLVTCWEMADLLALVGDVYCVFVTFPRGILGQVMWYLIVSFPDLCHLSKCGMVWCDWVRYDAVCYGMVW